MKAGLYWIGLRHTLSFHVRTVQEMAENAQGFRWNFILFVRIISSPCDLISKHESSHARISDNIQRLGSKITKKFAL
jgi:hypothetical protein